MCIYLGKTSKLKQKKQTIKLVEINELFGLSTAPVQEHFAASGGLETLALSLVRLASLADVSLMSCQLSVTITKTISACVTDNGVYCSFIWKHMHNIRLHKYPHFSLSTDNLLSLAPLASGLAKYGIVSHLFSLLACPNLNPVDQISVLLTLGCCTQASGKSAL